jgi:hypothetical protein
MLNVPEFQENRGYYALIATISSLETREKLQAAKAHVTGDHSLIF